MSFLRSIIQFWLLAGLLCSSPLARGETAPVTFVAPHFHEKVSFFGVGQDGELLPQELDLLGQLMRCRRVGVRHAIHPKLAGHLVAIARHFRRPVTVVSGYRSVSINGHRRSYHLRGMAADVYVPGVRAQDIRNLAVMRNVTGIGFYPRSGFVHIDTRERPFWWVDYSRPGELEQLIPDPDGNAPSFRPAKTQEIAQNR